MLQYLAPTTLKQMYKDLDEARLDILRVTNGCNIVKNTTEYSELTNLVQEIDAQYLALTGNELWVEVELESIA